MLDIIYDHRNDLVPTVVGLRQYLQTLTQAIRIPVGDGTYMAAVEGLLGGGACSFFTCPGTTAAPATAAPTAAPPPPAPVPSTPLDPVLGAVSGAVLPGTQSPQGSPSGSGVGQLMQYLAKVGSQ